MSNKVENQLPNIPIDFATNDYRGYFEMMKEAIPILTPEWTDTSDTDQGIVILQLLSYGLHVLGYYQERTMQENILEMARTKKGILTGCGFLGYTPKRQTASVVKLKIKRDSDYTVREDYVPIRSKFSTDPQLGIPIIFETVEPVYFAPNATEVEVDAIQGETLDSVPLGVSNGKAGQSFVIPDADVLTDSLFIYTYENNTVRAWNMVDNFLESEEMDRHFSTTLDEEDRTIIKFSDGIFGRIPSNELTIFATYRVGGGKLGNLAPNLINHVYESEFDLSFVDSVTNEDWSTGGTDYEDLQRAKILAPKHYRSREKAVTPLDFEDLAELQTGIFKAKCIETKITTKAYLYLLGDGYTLPTTAKCKEVKDFVDERRVGNVDLEVLPCIIRKLDVKMRVYAHDGFDIEQVKSDVHERVEDTFNDDYFDFGQEFFSSKLIDIAFNTAGVKNVVIDSDVTKDILDVGEYTILQLNSVVVEGSA